MTACIHGKQKLTISLQIVIYKLILKLIRDLKKLNSLLSPKNTCFPDLGLNLVI